MLPQFYHSCLKNYLSESQLLTLEILLWLLQAHKEVKIERLAALFPVPILYQSRRKHLQRFLVLPNLSLPLIWFPIIKYILRTQIPLGSRVILAIDRTQWDSNNLLMIAVIWKKRSFPVYWQFLDKAGSSNISEQIAVIRPVLKLLSRYQVVLIGDREFRSVELAYWLKQKKVLFALRIKQDTYIRQSEGNYQQLSELGLTPGMKLFYSGVNYTKKKGLMIGILTPLLACWVSLTLYPTYHPIGAGLVKLGVSPPAPPAFLSPLAAKEVGVFRMIEAGTCSYFGILARYCLW